MWTGRVRNLVVLVVLVITPLAVTLSVSHLAYGDTPKLEDRSDELSDSTVGATSTNLFSFAITENSSPLGSIEFQFCSNDPLPDLACTAPTGFDAGGAILSNQSGNTGFTISSAASNVVVLSQATPISSPTETPNSYQLDNIVNPTTLGTYYIRLYIYPTTDASGAETENGGIAISTTQGLSISSEVPPYLLFCSGVSISGHDCNTAVNDYINFGDFSTISTSTATSQFVTGTNAPNGYSISVNGTTLTSGNNVVNALSTPSRSQGGVNQFGLNLRANDDPPGGSDPQDIGTGPYNGTPTTNYDNPNLFTFNNGDVVVYSPSVSDYQNFTATYIININATDPVGVYTTTLTYICLANF